MTESERKTDGIAVERLSGDEATKNGGIFGFGTLNPYAKYFTGKSYLETGLISEEDRKAIPFSIDNVTFEPGCYNNWHKHNGGYQVLICTSGEGWVQIWGQPARRMRPGDVAVIPDGVKHWHGAAKGHWFSHIALTAGTPEWLERLSQEDYDKLPE